MSSRVGLVSGRSELVVQVSALVAEAGADIVLGGPTVWPTTGQTSATRVEHAAASGLSGAGDGHQHRVDALIVDALSDPAEVGVLAGPGADGRGLVVVCWAGEGHAALARAAELGAGHVVELPGGRSWLLEWLDRRPGSGVPLVGVLGAVGGAGATTVAAALASACGALLVDLDPDGAGLDLPLGLDDAPGIRWQGLPREARGPLDHESFLAALPRAGAAPVLAGVVPDPDDGLGPVASVLATARAQRPGAVLDLGRRDHHRVLGPEDRLVLVTTATVAGVVAARRILDNRRARVVLAVRAEGWLPRAEVLAELGADSVVWVPRLRRARELAECGQLLTGATGRTLHRVGREILELVA